MYAKVFQQIFDSSIAEDFTTRHVFMDLLVLADSAGCVDMTIQAIARRTNMPIEIVEKAIASLCKEDKSSRTKTLAGKRIVLIDEHRDWGWRIVNYEQYSALRDEDDRRAYMRLYMRNKRANSKQAVNNCKQPLAELAHTDTYTDTNTEEGERARVLENDQGIRTGGTAIHFEPPTPAEVTQYAESIGYKLDGAKFCHHYAAIGWKRGNTPITDWKELVCSWKVKDQADRANPASAPGSHRPAPSWEDQRKAAYDAAVREIVREGLKRYGEDRAQWLQSCADKYRDVPRSGRMPPWVRAAAEIEKAEEAASAATPARQNTTERVPMALASF